jgi:predicted RNA binding protein YcfA (HicA-like mRNA interferase family)
MPMALECQQYAGTRRGGSGAALAKPDGTTTPPKVLNHNSAKALLEANGWVATTGGKHSTKMEKQGRRPVTIPRHGGNDYGPQLRAAILRQAGLTH